MKSTIELNGMQFRANHGVLPQERSEGNDFVVDFSCKYDISKAAESDELNDTLNYASVYDIISREMAQPSNLLEHVAGRIATSLKNTFPELEHFSLKVTKLNPPVAGPTTASSVTMEF